MLPSVRRIVIAEYAHATYNEYLPLLMGRPAVEKHTLQPGAEGPGAGYIQEVNPGVLASFALASYRNPAVSATKLYKRAFIRTYLNAYITT